MRVEGEGVHEIPVGPVHAGTIEPGHFRFSVVGEKVLRLEERLGFAHKGIEKRAEGLEVTSGARLVARTSGDSAAAYAWAYAMAVEAVTVTPPPPRALALRGLLLERERIANHVGDIGGIANDAGFAFGLSQCSRLKEDLLRANARVWGRRYPLDAIVPGGVRDDVDADAVRVLLEDFAALEAELLRLREIYDNHAGLQDRFIGAGTVSPELAVEARRRRLGRACQRSSPGLAPGIAGRSVRDHCHRPGRAFRTATWPRALPCVSTRRWPRSACAVVGLRRYRMGNSSRRSARRAPARLASAASKDGAGRCWSPCAWMRTPASRVAIRTIRRGTTGRCWNTRSSTTSFQTFR